MKENAIKSQSFNCPNCSALLNLAGIVSPTLRCPYCHTSVIIPEELRRKSPGLTAAPLSSATDIPISQAELEEKLDLSKSIDLAGNKILAIKALRKTFEIGIKQAADRNGAVYTVVGSQLYAYDGLTGNQLGRLDHPDGWGFTDVTVGADGTVVAAWYKNQDDIIRFKHNG